VDTYAIIIIIDHLETFIQDASGIEKGTPSQLKILLNNAATVDPDKNINGCKDFFC